MFWRTIDIMIEPAGEIGRDRPSFSFRNLLPELLRNLDDSRKLTSLGLLLSNPRHDSKDSNSGNIPTARCGADYSSLVVSLRAASIRACAWRAAIRAEAMSIPSAG